MSVCKLKMFLPRFWYIIRVFELISNFIFIFFCLSSFFRCFFFRFVFSFGFFCSLFFRYFFYLVFFISHIGYVARPHCLPNLAQSHFNMCPMRFLLQLITKIDSPHLSHHFFLTIFLSIRFNPLDLVFVADDSWPAFNFADSFCFGKAERVDRVNQNPSTNFQI